MAARSVTTGVLYDHSRVALMVFAVVIQARVNPVLPSRVIRRAARLAAVSVAAQIRGHNSEILRQSRRNVAPHDVRLGYALMTPNRLTLICRRNSSSVSSSARADVAVSGIVVEDVQPPELRTATFDGLSRRCGVGDVQSECQRTVATGTHKFHDGFWLEACRDHTPAALEDGERHRPAESARCSGDEPYFPGFRCPLRVHLLHHNHTQNMPCSFGESCGIA
jgi:hypothetical protein